MNDVVVGASEAQLCQTGKQYGDMTYTVCANALREAYRALDEARRARREAAHTLATIRETLDQVLEIAYEKQTFGPLNRLFDEEEAALATHEQSIAVVNEAETRLSALSTALSFEDERITAGQISPSRMN